MQETLNTNKSSKAKKSGSENGKWVARQDAEMDNEAATPSTLSPATSSTPSVTEDSVSTSGYKDLLGNAKGVYDNAVSRGSDLLSKVDLSAGTRIVRDYPVQAAVGGLIVGFLVGAAVFSRRD